MSQLLLVTMLLLSGILSLSLINYVTNRRLKKLIKGTDVLLSVNILKAALFFCCGLLISEIGIAGKEVLNFQAQKPGAELALLLAGYLSLFLLISLMMAFLCIWFSRLIFSTFTKGKDIYMSSANSEIAEVILFVGILSSITFIVKPGLMDLLLHAIQYSTLPIYH